MDYSELKYLIDNFDKNTEATDRGEELAKVISKQAEKMAKAIGVRVEEATQALVAICGNADINISLSKALEYEGYEVVCVQSNPSQIEELIMEIKAKDLEGIPYKTTLSKEDKNKDEFGVYKKRKWR